MYIQIGDTASIGDRPADQYGLVDNVKHDSPRKDRAPTHLPFAAAAWERADKFVAELWLIRSVLGYLAEFRGGAVGGNSDRQDVISDCGNRGVFDCDRVSGAERENNVPINFLSQTK